MKRRQPERDIHIAVVRHLKARGVPGLVFFHPANGGSRHVREAANLKRMGVLPGASDLILLHGGRCFALELKADENPKLTEAQMLFLSDWNSAGGYAGSAIGLNAALKALETWQLLKPDRGST